MSSERSRNGARSASASMSNMRKSMRTQPIRCMIMNATSMATMNHVTMRTATTRNTTKAIIRKSFDQKPF